MSGVIQHYYSFLQSSLMCLVTSEYMEHLLSDFLAKKSYVLFMILDSSLISDSVCAVTRWNNSAPKRRHMPTAIESLTGITRSLENIITSNVHSPAKPSQATPPLVDP